MSSYHDMIVMIIILFLVAPSAIKCLTSLLLTCCSVTPSLRLSSILSWQLNNSYLSSMLHIMFYIAVMKYIWIKHVTDIMHISTLCISLPQRPPPAQIFANQRRRCASGQISFPSKRVGWKIGRFFSTFFLLISSLSSLSFLFLFKFLGPFWKCMLLV